MDLFNGVIISMKIKDSTKVNYINRYKLALKMGLNCNSTEENIISVLIQKTTGNKLKDFLTIFIVYKREMKEECELLRQFRKSLKKDVDEETETNKNLLLPDIEELYSHLDKIKDQKGYIINYLLLSFYCRNKDLDLTITDNKTLLNDKDNFLFIKENTVEFIRNSYKTKKKYGTKRYEINNVEFREQCLKMESKKLVNNLREIRKYTYKNLGQGSYLKIFLKTANKNDLYKIYRSRGTDIKQILTYYDINKF